MEKIVNKPLAGTFGWLHVNGTRVDAPADVETAAYRLEEGDERTVVADLASASHITAEVGKNATLRLIQLRRAGEGGTCLNDVRVRCAEGARFEWYRVVLGGAATYDNCSVELEGDGSSFAAEIGYRLGGDEALDVNCEAIHTGRKTESAIRASGVLSDRAHKLLRGTIDLRKGCKGAVGNELEDVLLMDETVRNQSVPVILCAEEDVVGNHGATIGRLDEKVVYYLESRGMARDAIYDMMAKAKLDAVLRKIPDETTRRELLREETAEALPVAE